MLDEGPDSITLNALAFEVAKSLVLICGTGRTKLDQLVLNRRVVYAGNADSGAERIALGEAAMKKRREAGYQPALHWSARNWRAGRSLSPVSSKPASRIESKPAAQRPGFHNRFIR